MNNKEKNINFILLNIGQASHNADWNWKNINSPFARIHYIQSGTAQIIREDGIFDLKPGHLYLTPPYTTHRYACNDVLSLCYIHIYEELNEGYSIFEQLHFPVEIEMNHLDRILIDRLIEINPGRELQAFDPHDYDNSSTLMRNIAQNEQMPLTIGIETKGILQQLFSRFLAHTSYKSEKIDKRIAKALYYIHKNIDQPINIDHLGEICFLTKDHFIRLFKKEMKCTPLKYINQKKIEKAQLLLVINDMPLKDIAYSLSIDNCSYFNRLFKKTTGETPGAYKKRMLSGV